jgi:hypothetical protein
MAIYKLFPECDTTLYSGYPTSNTGLDEILEATTNLSFDSSYADTSRPLLKFYTDEITDVITNKISGSSFDAYLRLFLANASKMPATYSVECYPVYQPWDMGTGKYGDSPINTSGASWSNISSTNLWQSSSFPAYVTASYVSTNKGGGNWYTGSSTLNLISTQSFSYHDNKDINIKVTNAIRLISSGTISNNGFIIKQRNEFLTSSIFELKYFSIDTHTIYPPCLEFRWNDYSSSTGSLETVVNDNIIVSLQSNKASYNQSSVTKFRVNARNKYPVKTFVTSSQYVNNLLLPYNSWWALKDLDTNEIVIDFDDTYTRLSADTSGNYFNLYMNGLEPERYYKVLIKTIISNNVILVEDNYYFKVNK